LLLTIIIIFTVSDALYNDKDDSDASSIVHDEPLRKKTKTSNEQNVKSPDENEQFIESPDENEQIVESLDEDEQVVSLDENRQCIEPNENE
jgi:hypothetical protein